MCRRHQLHGVAGGWLQQFQHEECSEVVGEGYGRIGLKGEREDSPTLVKSQFVENKGHGNYDLQSNFAIVEVWELASKGMIQLLPTFHGMDSENPYIHIKEFEEVCNTFIDRTCTEETIRLKLFPFSLKDKAKLWLNSLRPMSIGMIQLLPTFHGMDSENPYIHIKEFEEVCNTFIDRTCTEETIRLKLFPFSLKDKAKLWLNSLRPMSIGMIQLLPTFHGMDSENPYIHIKEFEEVCNTFIDRTCTEETIRLKLFPFSLKDKAKLWLNSPRPMSIGTWREMQAEFLKKYFPTHRTTALQRQMMNFSCSPNESFHQAWEKFKDLLNACPHHGFEMWRLVSFFYDSLTANFKKQVSTICNGEFYEKEPSEAVDIFDQLAENIKQWETSLPLHVESRNTISHSSGKFQLKETDDLNARLASLARKVESLEIKKKVLVMSE
ncbi:hypothetical protein SADUNF_Sadunf04G0096100 [Salix dunnii]|uniref:Retrotransposon gag domain-containing protein n=1 Tax=Salix dunnii TaxID=1413687 RepID=A0A835K927_9ROSI|nr:hypothetical protein SADUNF_Sadunf04G0096100 [Salix dunnii]